MEAEEAEGRGGGGGPRWPVHVLKKAVFRGDRPAKEDYKEKRDPTRTRMDHVRGVQKRLLDEWIAFHRHLIETNFEEHPPAIRSGMHLMTEVEIIRHMLKDDIRVRLEASLPFLEQEQEGVDDNEFRMQAIFFTLLKYNTFLRERLAELEGES